MGGNKSKRPEPSHKTGKLRDKRIEKMMDPEYKVEHLHALIQKAATTKKRYGAGLGVGLGGGTYGV